MGLLDGKLALVTGAARGIGHAIALTFAQQGATVVFANRSKSAAFDGTLAALQAIEPACKGYQLDVSDREGCTRLVEAVSAEFGHLDVLVNNAGITQDALLMRMTEAQWDQVLEVNLKSVFNMTQAAQGPMLKQRHGSIINMASVVGLTGNAGQANYAASKAGVIGFSKSVAKELGSRNVRCNAIAPGFIVTDMTAGLSEKVRKEWEAQIPLRRGGTPEDVANAALFLASDLSAYVTGQVLQVCGGMAM